MEKIYNSIIFLRPSCKDNFEFDSIGEYQLVPCPICGVDFITIRKAQKLILESYEFILKTANQTENAHLS